MHFATTTTKNIGRMGPSKIVDFWFIDIYQKKNSFVGPALLVESNIQLLYFLDYFV